MFEGFDAVVLARAQFAFTVSFHIVFPAFSIGLASYLAVLEALWLWTGREVFINLFNYWLKIFAVAFGMGVVSGIVMAYQFGTNWSAFSDKTGPVIGPLMAYEVLTAFFLEAGFLGVMLFGLQRVGPRLHFLATLMVAIGTLISAFWILSANSWMQTPAGYAINESGQFVAARLDRGDLQSVLPLPPRAHGACGLSDHGARGRRGRRLSSLARPASRRPACDVLDGDVDGDAGGADPDPGGRPARTEHAGASADKDHGDGRPFREPQGRRAADPVRLAERESGQDEYAVEVPKLGSLILKHSLDAPLAGLDTVPRENWPPVPITFWAFRIMVGLGFLIMGLGLFSLWMRWRGRLYQSRLLHLFAMAMGPAGFIAVLAGWITTETGRQPFTVYGLLRTVEFRLAAGGARGRPPRWSPSSSSISRCLLPAWSISCA